MIRKRRISQLAGLVLAAITLPVSNGFTTRPTTCTGIPNIQQSSGCQDPTSLRASINNKEDTPRSEPDKLEENGSSTRTSSQSQSVLYYDRASQYNNSQKKRKKEQKVRNSKIAVYHNILQKNANDCSVCTVPDKIDASKIVKPTRDKPNGIAPAPTWELRLEEIKRSVNHAIREPSVELAEFVLIFASSLFVALSTVPILPPPLTKTVYFCQDATLFLFAFGFLSRWWSSLEPKGTYFEDPLEWVDFVVVVLPFLFFTVPGLASLFPAWLTSQTGLINLRLLRVLRFQRILQDEITFSKFVSGLRVPGTSKEDALSCVIVERWQLQLARVLLSIFTLLSVASGLIYSAEHVVNPGIPDYFSALYFGLTTLTTVGFGDVVPMTWEGKLVVSGSILAGVAIIPAQAAALVEALLERDAEIKDSNTMKSSFIAPPPPASTTKNPVLETSQTCPSCNAGLHWSQANFCYNCGEKFSA